MRAKGIALAILAVLLAASAPPWPDDWDGLGFVAAVSRFDMDRFAPHPPGYPVYVALAKVAALVLRAPLLAATAVSVLAGLGVAALVHDAATRAFGAARGWAIAVAVSVTPLVWRAESGVGTEGLALFFAALAAWGAVRTRGAWVGVAVGLGLGVRLSWAPLYLALLVLAPRAVRVRACACAVGATAAWAGPLAWIVGPSHLRDLFSAHLAGHATRWGGTALVDPGAQRIVYLARDVFVDGLGLGSDGLGLVIGFLVIAVFGIGFMEWRRDGFPLLRVALIALGPYLLWIALGQNLRQQPRHALPVVAAASAALALAAMSVDRARRLGVALVTLVAARTSQDAYARKTTPPAGEQIVAAVRDAPRPTRIAVFAGPSARFFEPTELAGAAHAAATLGDVRIELGKMRELPARVLVTQEIEGWRAPPYPSVAFGKFCRPERIDRRAPCLDVVELKIPFLPQE